MASRNNGTLDMFSRETWDEIALAEEMGVSVARLRQDAKFSRIYDILVRKDLSLSIGAKRFRVRADSSESEIAAYRPYWRKLADAFASVGEADFFGECVRQWEEDIRLEWLKDPENGGWSNPLELN